jgi:RNA polymerase sigma factor for flagellar operon FliA
MVSTLKVEKQNKTKIDTITTEQQSVLEQKPKRVKQWDVSEREWARYWRLRTPELRKQLLDKYVPLVRNVATRMSMNFPRSVELNDLISTGMIGLIEAFKNFDPDRGVKFETYAVPRIRGAILDELRALDWVPRSTRAKSRDIDRAYLTLENQHGRKPELTELAKEMNFTMDEMNHAIDDVSSTHIMSLDEVVYREDDNRQVPRIETIIDKETISILSDLEKKELKAFLGIAITRLTEQEKLVIALYYYEELTLKEIGEVMTISESRVSQIHTRAVMKMRNMIKDRFGMTS